MPDFNAITPLTDKVPFGFHPPSGGANLAQEAVDLAGEVLGLR